MEPDDPHTLTQSFPPTLPVFPLSGALLLPGGQLPLNIFEECYVQMIDDALRTGDRLIGMVQPKRNGDHKGSVYNVGCAGRIVSFEETDDGRYIIILKGLKRFDIETETQSLSRYRRMKIDWQGYDYDLQPQSCRGFKRDEFFDLLTGYFARHELEVEWDVLHETPDERLISVISMICPFDVREKQALLEAETSCERGKLLIALLEMAVHEQHHENSSV